MIAVGRSEPASHHHHVVPLLAMFRYRDYMPLPVWSDSEPGSAFKAKNTYEKRRRIVQGVVALSVLANVYFAYAFFTAWPNPLDNYQAL